MSYPTGPCDPWITGADVTQCSEADPSLLDAAAEVACDVLFHLSGMQFPGECERTVRPGLHKCGCGGISCRTLTWLPDWVTTYRGGYDSFTCCDASRARLGFSPVTEITSVTIDSVVVPPAEYRVDDYTELVRVDGSAWPLNDTWEVVFTAGVAPPASGILAARQLACEIALLISESDACSLPQRITNLNRQGVSMVFDPMDFIKDGRTGIFIVDLFLATHNPDHLRAGPVVAIPYEAPQVTRQTWP